MLISFHVVTIVRSGVRAAGTLNYVSRPEFCLTSGEIGEQDFFLVAVFASETEIPLAGG